MNPTLTPTRSRLDRLAQLLQEDPANPLLLADAADEALAAGELGRAEQYIAEGQACEGSTHAWRFRLANVRLAQRRLGEAGELLEALRRDGLLHPSVDHNLAYVAFLRGDFAGCAALLDPWLANQPAPPPERDALEALWLRAMHHADALQAAWTRIESWGIDKLGAQAAGVASLIASDLSRMEAAEMLSAAALRADPQQAEALVARASVQLSRRDTAAARGLLVRLTQAQPHQARAWSTLGFVDLLELDAAAARRHFGKALEIHPRDVGTLTGLGWACLAGNDLQAAAAAFETILAIDADSADGHGGLAVALALQGATQRSGEHAQQAKRLQRGNVAARYAQAVLTGHSAGLEPIQRLARRLLGEQASGRAGANPPPQD